MAISVLEALTYVSHFSYGKQGPVVGKASIREALREMDGSHQWKFLHAPAITLTLVKDQDYVALPADFREFIAWEATEGLQGRFRLVDIGEILRRRANLTGTATQFFMGALEYAPSTAPKGGAPTPRLAVWPVPLNTLTDWITIVYRRDLPMPSDDDDDMLQFPDYMNSVFNRFLEAIVKGYAFDDAAQRGARPGRTLENRLGEVRSGSTFRTAVARDGTQQPSMGQIRNGSVADRFRGPLNLATTVAPPQ